MKSCRKILAGNKEKRTEGEMLQEQPGCLIIKTFCRHFVSK